MGPVKMTSRPFQRPEPSEPPKRREWITNKKKRIPEMADDGNVHTPEKRGWILVELPPGVGAPEAGAPTLLDEMRARQTADRLRDRFRKTDVA